MATRADKRVEVIGLAGNVIYTAGNCSQEVRDSGNLRPPNRLYIADEHAFRDSMPSVLGVFKKQPPATTCDVFREPRGELVWEMGYGFARYSTSGSSIHRTDASMDAVQVRAEELEYKGDVCMANVFGVEFAAWKELNQIGRTERFKLQWKQATLQPHPYSLGAQKVAGARGIDRNSHYGSAFSSAEQGGSNSGAMATPPPRDQ